MKKEIVEFNRLAKKATEAMGELFDAPSIVPYASKMIELVHQNNGLKTEFIEAIIALWHSNEIEYEVIAFCCHALKWTELKEYFTKELIDSDLNEDIRTYHVLETIVESFDPNWEDASDFYGDYFDI